MSPTQTMRRIIVTMPPDLLKQVEETAEKLDFNRSQFIRRAVETFLEEQHRHELRESLKEGYLYRAQESLDMAGEFYAAEQEAWDQYAPWEE
jgi:metal-responsive CopG/Arc/MetJ family transcriptional regulator